MTTDLAYHMILIPSNKRYLIIDQQIARQSVQFSEYLSNPLPFWTTQIITLFLVQGSQPIMIRGKDFSLKSLYPLMFL